MLIRLLIRVLFRIKAVVKKKVADLETVRCDGDV